MIALSVNVNKIALIRNSREGNHPDVVAHAATCIAAGADGITVHPRPDQRHIRPHDVIELAELSNRYPNIEFNIEGNPFAPAQGDYPGLIALVEKAQPQQCTLVPDSSDQLTSDHGFNLISAAETLAPIISRLKALGVRISLFMDADIEQIDLARQLGVERIELYTGPYAAAWNDVKRRDAVYEQYRAAAEHATEIGLGVNGGHDLNLENLAAFATVPGLLEVSIGHALIIDALEMGLHRAVQAYQTLLTQAVS
jgi:pyridoxine 5-phosphate synthase